MIGILKIGYGNIQSIRAAIERLGYDFVELTSETACFDEVTHLIIPGVGNYAKASSLIYDSNLHFKILNYVKTRKPVLGICLGMQIFTSIGYEGVPSKGLGFFGGETKILNDDETHILPHVGWNNVDFCRNHPVFRGLKSGTDFYFTHSYAVNNINAEYVCGKTYYGEFFPSVIAHANVVGTQFHPEKSLKNGMKLIDNFCQWDGQC